MSSLVSLKVFHGIKSLTTRAMVIVLFDGISGKKCFQRVKTIFTLSLLILILEKKRKETETHKKTEELLAFLNSSLTIKLLTTALAKRALNSNCFTRLTLCDNLRNSK